MALSNELISELVRVTNTQKAATAYDNTVYGTIVDDGEQQYAQIDGSDTLTPIATTVELNAGDRVVVTIKNHTATVMGNTTSPAVGVMSQGNLKSTIEQQADRITLAVEDIGNVRSELTLTASQIRSEVDDIASGFNSSITQNANQITSLVQGQATITDTITGMQETQDVFTEFKQTVEGFSFMGTGGTVKIQLNDLSTEVNTAIENATPLYQYSKNGLTAWTDWYSGMDLSSYRYRRESYDGGATWTGAYQFAGRDGYDGIDGSDASVTYSNIKSALNRASNAAMTILSGSSIDTVDVYANNIYGGNFYAGSGDDLFARVSSEGFLLYHSNNPKPKIKLGLNSSEVDAGIDSNYASVHLVLGSGTHDDDENAGRLYLIKNDSMGGIYYYDPYNNRCGISFLPSGEMVFHGTVSGLTPTFG